MRISNRQLPLSGDEVVGSLFSGPGGGSQPPYLIVVATARVSSKRIYFEMFDHCFDRCLACVATIGHGHVQSGGQRFHNVKIDHGGGHPSAVRFSQTRSEVECARVGAFGGSLPVGGKRAILEPHRRKTALKVLICLDATVRNSRH